MTTPPPERSEGSFIASYLRQEWKLQLGPLLKKAEQASSLERLGHLALVIAKLESWLNAARKEYASLVQEMEQR